MLAPVCHSLVCRALRRVICIGAIGECRKTERGTASTRAHIEAEWPFNGQSRLFLISCLSAKMTGWQQSFVVKALRGSPLSGESSLFGGGCLDFFTTKMTPDLLVNKAITEELIGRLFMGTSPQEAEVFRPPWSWASPKALWRLCSFSTLTLPLFCLIRLYPFSSGSLSISVSLILFFKPSFIPGSLL